MKRKKGEEAFDAFYFNIYAGRWDQLKKTLLKPKEHIVYLNPYLKNNPHPIKMDSTYPAPQKIDDLMNYYFLDFASTLPVKALDIKNDDQVIDLCAAPGGKSLMIMGENPKSLICNDLSHDRLQRLKKIMQDYLPEDIQKKITYTKRDASLWGTFEKEIYDKTLLDAPCSSERHFLQRPNELTDWSEGRTKRLAKLQFALLAAAIDITKSGGRIVYSTCSISPYENDEVIKKALKKRSGQFEIEKNLFDESEATEFGQQVLPDKNGHGPFYLSILRKI